MKKITLCIASALLMLVVVACNHTENGVAVEFDATLPILNEEEQDGSKTYFVGERYVYWEQSDSVVVCISEGNDYEEEGADEGEQSCSLAGGGNTRDGSFRIFIGEENEPEGFGESVSMFPSSSEINSSGKMLKNTISYDGSDFVFKCFLSDKQYYRPGFRVNSIETDSDLTFSKKALPMVAYCTGGKPRLRFYTPCGLIRLQLFSSSTATKGFVNLKTITITCDATNDGSPTNLSGQFSVEDYKTMNPTLIPESTASTDQTIVYDCGDEGVLIDNDVKSFYIVIPYVDGSAENRTRYNFTVEFKNDRDQVQTGHLTARVARNTITKIPAIDVKTKDISIVGNGTALRPFQIYDVEDLIKVRDAFESSDPYLNGVSLKPVSDSVYFVLSRGDITLTTVNWTKGIKFNERCAFYGSENVITNNSANPIFASSYGSIRHLYVQGTCSAYSPLCDENYGMISHCHSNVVNNASHNFGGLCYQNNGTIRRCDYGIVMGVSTATGTSDFSGICDQNTSDGTIEECFCDCSISNPGGVASGICRSNEGNIENSYFTKELSGDRAFGICHTNSGNVVRCHTQNGNIIKGKKEAAGICGANTGLIDMCYNLSDVETELQDVAGLVITNNGTMRNVYNEGGVSSESGNASGMVATNTGGTLRNGFNLGNVSSDNVGGGAFVVGIVGTVAGEVENCYTTGGVDVEGSGGQADAVSTGSGSFTTCYYLDGHTTSTDAVVKTDLEMKSQDFVDDLNGCSATSGDDYREWVLSSSYPRLNM